jgi:hypothetical protein
MGIQPDFCGQHELKIPNRPAPILVGFSNLQRADMCIREFLWTTGLAAKDRKRLSNEKVSLLAEFESLPVQNGGR